MATRDQIIATYDYMDDFFRGVFGDHADITGALYDGDQSKSLEQAQADKHAFIIRELNVQPGHRVLDVGCGWGPLLNALRAHGTQGVGLTLSLKQARACHAGGLDVRLADWKETDPDSLGAFDAVASVGAFEHFCSEEEFRAGQQESIYRSFFAFVEQCLPRGGRLYLQTMTWGDQVPDPDRLTTSAPRGSDEYILAVIRKFYPGSWLPSGLPQIEEAARGQFRVVGANSGRLDYIATMHAWGRRVLTPRIRTLALLPSFILQAVRDREFRYKLESVLGNHNRICFERRLFDHQRIVLESVR